jgi:phosphoribosylformylglycinamidine (FGAM) synthase PurS component
MQGKIFSLEQHIQEMACQYLKVSKGEDVQKLQIKQFCMKLLSNNIVSNKHKSTEKIDHIQ